MGVVVFKNGKISNKYKFGGSYDGEKQMGDLNDMVLFDSDANGILDSSYGLLTERSTTLYHTYGAVRSAINKQVEYAIGGGLVFRSQPDWQLLGISKEEAKEWGKQFQKIVHYYQNRYNLYEKQSVMFRTALYEGDSLVFFERKDGMLNDIIELAGGEIDWEYNTYDYTLGIKHDEFLRRKGIRKCDGKEISFQDSDGDQNLVQFYIKELSRQLRGYPLAYSVINLARNDDTFSDATTHRAVMEAIIMATFKGNGTDLGKQLQNMADVTKKNKQGALNTIKSAISKIGNVKRLGAGNILTLNNTEGFEFNEIKTPSNNYDPFKKWGLNYVAMATGTPPEVILSKYESSYTAHKGALNDFVKSFTKKRQTFERNVMDICVKEIAKDAIRQGLIQAPGFFDNEIRQQAYLRGMYLHPQVGHINPLQEVKAQLEAVNGGVELRSNIASLYGNEWDNYFEEWAEEEKKYREASQDERAEAVFNREVNNG